MDEIDSTDGFEWDSDKAIRNYIMLNVSFREAISVFEDPFAIGEIDDREVYGEERFIYIGIAGNKLLNVVYTERGERIRIISARKATNYERESYYRQNAT